MYLHHLIECLNLSKQILAYLPKVLCNIQDLETLWMLLFKDQNGILMLWHSKAPQENCLTQVVRSMQPILLTPTRTDVVKQTLLRSTYAIVTYNLAITKHPKQMNCEESPEFGDSHCNIFSGIGKLLEGAVGPHLLSEAHVVAMGFLNRFLKGKSLSRWPFATFFCIASAASALLKVLTLKMML